MLRTNYSLLGEVIAARRNYTEVELMQIAINNMKHAKVKTVKTETHNGKVTTKTPFDLTVTSYPDLGYSIVMNNGKVIYKERLVGEIGEAHAKNVQDFMAKASTADLRYPIN
jgi:hypothetical protein